MVDNTATTKPSKVAGAEILLWISLLVRAFYFLRESPYSAPHFGIPVTLAIFLIFCITGVMGFLVYKIGKGKNWARISFLCIFIYGLVNAIWATIHSPARSHFLISSYNFPATLQLIALVFLFQKDSSAWFRARGRPAERTAEDHRASPEDKPESAIQKGFGATPSDQPLLILKYRQHQQFLRIVLCSFGFLIFGFGLLIAVFQSGTFIFSRLFYGVASAILFLASIYALIDVLLFEEIRLYNDRMVKEWHLRGTLEIELQNAAYSGRDYWFTAVRCLRNPDTRRYLSNFKAIVFDQSMIHPKTVEKLNSLLAQLSGRSVEEFKGSKVSFERLMKGRKG